jgi:Protein kinase domain
MVKSVGRQPLPSGLKKKNLNEVISAEDPKKRFTDLRKVGEGASGTVFMALDSHNGNKAVAIKEMELIRQPKPEVLVNEVVLMDAVDDAAIVKFSGAYMVEGALWVVMEFVDGEDLTQVLSVNDMTEPQIACVLKETLLALQHMHSRNILHRDIKSDNSTCCGVHVLSRSLLWVWCVRVLSCYTRGVFSIFRSIALFLARSHTHTRST